MSFPTIEEQIANLEKHLYKLRKAGLGLSPLPEFSEEERAQLKKFEEEFPYGQPFPLLDFPLMNSSDVLTPLPPPPRK